MWSNLCIILQTGKGGATFFHLTLNFQVLTLKLGLHFPGAGGKPTKDVALGVLQDQKAGASVDNMTAQLRKALAVDPGGEEQLPLIPKFGRQVGIEVDDGREVQEADEGCPLQASALRQQVEDLTGFVGERLEEEQALLKHHLEEGGDLWDSEKPVFNAALVTRGIQDRGSLHLLPL